MIDFSFFFNAQWEADTAFLFTSTPSPGILFIGSTHHKEQCGLRNSLFKFGAAFWFIFSSNCLSEFGKVVLALCISGSFDIFFPCGENFPSLTFKSAENATSSGYVIWLLFGGQNATSFPRQSIKCLWTNGTPGYPQLILSYLLFFFSFVILSATSQSENICPHIS